jgi:hypothetical protein
MNTSALFLMIISEGIIAAITIYFFFRVLKSPPKPEPDSFEFNDDEAR